MLVPGERSARPPRAITLEKILLVEGDTPSHFFEAFLLHLGRSDTVEVRSFGGNSNLATYLKVLAATTEFRSTVKSLGIIRDAENDPDAAKMAIAQAISNASLPGTLSVAKFVLPDNRHPGMLETLCKHAVSNAPEYQCVTEFFNCIEKSGIAIDGGIKRDKHIAQVYLATRNDVQMFPGIAAYRGYWPFDSDNFNDLRSFLISL